MALTDSSRIFNTRVRDIDSIVAYCKQYFERQNYDVSTEKVVNGGFFSITKGGIFRTISGMKTGLNITITQIQGGLLVEMKVGLFGKQAIPAAIAMLVFWPVLIPQIYGLVQQNKLDAEAYNVIESAIHSFENYVAPLPDNTAFCVFCGAAMPEQADFCTSCGKRVAEETPKCSACGTELSEGSAFCHKCGAKV